MTQIASLAIVAAAELLLVAAVAKAFSFARFAGFLSSFGFTGREARLLGSSVVAVEAAIGIGLVSPDARPVASVAACITAVSFVLVQAHQVVRQGGSSCHCFGVLDPSESVWPATVRAVVTLFLVAVTAGSTFANVYARLNAGAWVTGTAIAVSVLLSTALASAAADFDARRHRALA